VLTFERGPKLYRIEQLACVALRSVCIPKRLFPRVPRSSIVTFGSGSRISGVANDVFSGCCNLGPFTFLRGSRGGDREAEVGPKGDQGEDEEKEVFDSDDGFPDEGETQRIIIQNRLIENPEPGWSQPVIRPTAIPSPRARQSPR
jgi:hypothetical protein